MAVKQDHGWMFEPLPLLWQEWSQSKTLSSYLSRVLDGAGVSERTVNKRRQTCLKTEKMIHLIIREGSDLDLTVYVFGSRIEGSTTLGLHPDVDRLGHWNDVTAIQSKRELKPEGKTNVLVLQGGDIPAGYCCLQLLPGKVSCSTDMVTGCGYKRDKDRVLLKHNMRRISGEAIHGPARTYPSVGYRSGIDMVYCIKCDSVSKQVEPWIRRMQNKQWPTRDMLKTATESGFFLVPVGHRLSANRDVEWRVSPSLTERCLMFGMNITQMKCYVTLKMIKKDLIIPKIGESITSFHLKNVLFHCVESSRSDLWREETLIACIDVCLKYLLSCVQKRSCPNFLIPGENLFSGKVTEEQISHLEKLLYEFIESDGLYLLKIKCDDVGDLLDTCLNCPSTVNLQLVYIREAVILAKLERANSRTILQTGENFLTIGKPVTLKMVQDKLVTLRNACQKPLPNASLYPVHDNIGNTRNILKCPDSLTRSVATSILQVLYSTYGSILASMCIRGGIGITQGALSYLERGCGYDLMSIELKKASALYCCGRYRQTAFLLEDLDSRYDSNCVEPACDCHAELPRSPKLEFVRRLKLNDTTSDNSKLKLNDTTSDNSKLLANHIAFTSQEIHCCPLPLRFDFFRGFEEDRARRQSFRDGWMDMAVVDSVIFLYFLMYLTYGSMGNRQLQRNALDNLIRSLSNKVELDSIKHYETAFNLLGQCYEKEGEPGKALLCYRKSLHRMPRNNSAPWLVTLLIYKHLWRHMVVLLAVLEFTEIVLRYVLTCCYQIGVLKYS